MAIITFLLILIVLVLVHEFGHFLVAKKTGMRVDEFGIGFPPRALTLFRKDGTIYSLNWLPFGGFVRIFGENYNEETLPEDEARSFVNRPKWAQALVLVAGVAMNVVIAWVLLAGSFMLGVPQAIESRSEAVDARVIVAEALPNSPAAQAGLRGGDTILSLSAGDETVEPVTTDDVPLFVATHGDEPIELTILRGNQEQTLTVTPIEGVVEGQRALGIRLALVGTVQYGPLAALVESFKATGMLLVATAVGLGGFFLQIFQGAADFTQVTGPVGIVDLVGDASALGLGNLLAFAAFISLNLAVINLLPFPALDGGRLLFVIIEAIKGSRINPKVANALNAAGFALLLLLMVVVTWHDIAKLVG